MTLSDGGETPVVVTLTEKDSETGEWTFSGVDLTELADGAISISAEVTDAAGNTATAELEDGLTLDTVAEAGIVTVGDITADDIVNIAESDSTIIVSGTAVGGDISYQDVVSFTVNGHDYETTVDVDGNWSVEVSGADLSEDPNFEVVVHSSDEAGNTVESSVSSSHDIDLSTFATINVDRVTDDKVINGIEASEGNLVPITGSVKGDAQPGDTITVSVDGNVIGTGVVSDQLSEDGNYYLFSVDVLGSDLANTLEYFPEVSVTVSGFDSSGNPFSQTNVQTYDVDLSATAGVVSITSLPDGNVIDLTDPEGDVEIAGTAIGGDISQGDVVSATINGKEYTTTVGANGVWVLSVTGSDLADDPDLEVVVTSSDSSGNTVLSTVSSELTVNVNQAPVAVDDTASGNEDTVITIDVLANDTDPENDSLSIVKAEVSGNQGTVEIVNGKLEFTPVDDFSGEVTIDYAISDGVLTSQASVTVTVDAVADAPTLEVELSDAVSQGAITLSEDNINNLGAQGDGYINSNNVTAESVSRVFDFGAEYAGQEVTISFDSDISGGWEDGVQSSDSNYTETKDTYTISINGVQQDQFTYEQNTGTPSHNQSNSYTVTLDADGKATVVFEVASTATVEVVDISNIQASVDSGLFISQLSIDGASTDTDGSEVLSYSISALPEGASLLDADGSVIAANTDGSYSFAADEVDGLQISTSQDTGGFDVVVTVTSTDGDSTSQVSQTITVGDLNTNPVAVDDYGFAGLVGSYYGTDTQIDSLEEFISVIANNEPTATFNATNIDYSSTGSTSESTSVATQTNLQTFLGDDAASLSSDPDDNTDGGIHLQGYIFLAAGTYNFQVYADDGYQISIDGENVATVSNNQSPTSTTHSEFEIAEDGYYAIDMIWWDQGGDYVFQPTISSDGGETYATLDSSMLSSIKGTPLSTDDEHSITISPETLLANDSDSDGDTLSISSISDVQNGYAYLNSDGNVVFIAAAGFSGTASFDYTITDGNGGFDTATASVEVTASAILPTVTVSLSDVIESSTSSSTTDTSDNWQGFSSSSEATKVFSGDYNSWTSFSDRDDAVYVGDDIDGADLNTKGGDDKVFIKDDIYSGRTVYLKDGDDKIIVGSAYQDGEVKDGSVVQGTIKAGSGNDEIQIGGSLTGEVYGNSGDDEILIGGDASGNIKAGSGSDAVIVGGNTSGYISLDDSRDSDGGNDSLTIKGSTSSSSIYAGTGNDSIVIEGDSSSHIELDDNDLSTGGDDSLYIGGSSSGTIQAGAGDDTVSIAGDVKAYVNLESGDDYLSVGGSVVGATIHGGSGNDFIVIEGALSNGAYIDGQEGTDSIVLKSYSLSDYQLNLDGIKYQVANFENILFSDGSYQGDITAFSDYLAGNTPDSNIPNSSDYAYTYNINVDIDNENATAEGATVNLFGIPTGVTVQLNGETLTSNVDGSYSFDIEQDQTSIDGLSILTDVELPEFELTSTVTNKVDDTDVDGTIVTDSFQSGTEAIDTLVGDLGSDVLFGGDDEAADILTGGAGNDVFILNDVNDQSNIDTITDFNAADDALDLTDLLSGIEGSPGKDADMDAITEFLEAHVKVEDGAVKVDDEDVANFVDETSSFDSNGDGSVNTSDSIKVIYNNEEYNINIDG
ncbi:Ig-like domain-containing protein [Marinomonas dokdonensis]|uniref:Ig-like domain-containing protein n=1 Tax=Marinomonas dokdonensis TaxID=328224 RepID=UPI00405579FE